MPRRALAIVVALAALILGTSEASAYVHLQIVEPVGPLDLGTVEVLSHSAPKRIRIRNIGTVEPDIYYAEISGSASFTIVAQGGSLAPGDTMYWDIVALPAPEDAPWGASAAFDLFWRYTPTDDDGRLSVLVGCDVTPSPYSAELQSFGEIAAGSAHTLTFPVTNTSTTAREITAFSVASGPFTAKLHGGSLPITVAPGATFSIDVRYAPSAAPAFHFTHLTILDDTGPHGAFQMWGIATVAQVALSTSALAFGDTFRYPSAPPTTQVTLTNAGTGAMTIPAATVTGAGFALVSSPPPGLLAPQGSAAYIVAFAPEAIGAFAGTLALGGLGQVALSGQGVLRPVSAAASLDLGPAFVGASVQRTLTLHNAGTSAITVSSLALGDPRFQVVSADRTIPPHGELAVVIAYAPTGEGDVVTELAIALDGDPEPQLAVALHGAGIALDAPTDPTPGDPPLYIAPGAAPADPVPDGADGGCSTHGGGAPRAALALALVPFARRRRARPARL